MPIGPARMPLMDHLGELRRRLTIMLVSVFATAIVLYFAAAVIIDWLMEPIQQYIGDLYVLDPLAGFTNRFLVAVLAAVVVASPIILWEVLAFFLPALKPNERQWVLPTLVAGVILFVGGIIFGYNLILGPAFGWMTSQADAYGTILANSTTYIHTVLGLMVAFGVAFELPLVIFYLSVFNLVPYKTFRKNWRVVYIILLVFSAMVTPDASPVTMFFLFAALVVLYELSLAIARFVISRRVARQKAEGTWVDPEAEKEDEDDDDDDDDDDEEDD